MSSTKAPQNTSQESMSCMEVWGGSCAADERLRRPGLDIWIQSPGAKATEAGGGDLHLLSSCASGRITRMLLADICGIGTLYAEIAAELRDLMKRNVNAIQQKRIVREVSRRLSQAAKKGGYASLLISTYFAPSRSFRLCNTGHPPPLIYRAKSGAWSTIKPDAPASAAFCEEKLEDVVSLDEYQQVETTLNFGDMVLCFSNSLTECRDTDGNIVGLSGILQRVQELNADDPDHLSERLVEQLRSEHPENEHIDQATLMLCRASDTKVGLKDNVLAPFRLLRRVGDKTRLE